MKKSKTYLGYGLAIVAGLVIGLSIRSAMTPGESIISTKPSPRKAVMNRPFSKQASLSLTVIRQFLERLEESPLSLEEESLLSSSLYDLEGKEWGELVKALSTLERLPSGQKIVRDLFSAWGEKAPLDALAAIPNLPHFLRENAKRSVMTSWVVIDADAAFAHYEKENPPIPAGVRFGPDESASLWTSLMSVAPEEALARAAKILNANERRSQENEIIRKTSYTDPQLTLDWLFENRTDEALKNNLANVIEGWATFAPQQALTFLLDLPQDLQSKEAYEDLASSMGRMPDLALSMVDKIPGAFRDTFIQALLEENSRYNPARAAEIGDHLPEGRDKHEAYNEIATNWGAKDPVAAAEWLLTLPMTLSRDRAIKGFAEQLLPHDPELAVTWLAAQSYSSDGLHSALLDWIGRDSTAARAWIEAQPEEKLTTVQKQLVLEGFEK